MKINLILAKVFKFITFVLFTFMTLVYFGVLLIVPLDVMTQLIRIFHGLGLPTVLAAGLGIGSLAYLGYLISKMPELYKLLVDIGVQLMSFGHTQIKRFDPIIDAAHQASTGSSAA
jgi:hypothetical protein